MDRILWSELPEAERQALIDAYEIALDAIINRTK